MALVTPTNFQSSLRFALRGVGYVILHERNFRIHTVFAVLAVALSVVLRISALQWLFVITAITSVIALEIVNTMFEVIVDLLQPRIHHYAGLIKDLMAATVLIASLSALIVGAIIFIPLILHSST